MSQLHPPSMAHQSPRTEGLAGSIRTLARNWIRSLLYGEGPPGEGALTGALGNVRLQREQAHLGGSYVTRRFSYQAVQETARQTAVTSLQGALQLAVILHSVTLRTDHGREKLGLTLPSFPGSCELPALALQRACERHHRLVPPARVCNRKERREQLPCRRCPSTSHRPEVIPTPGQVLPKPTTPVDTAQRQRERSDTGRAALALSWAGKAGLGGGSPQASGSTVECPRLTSLSCRRSNREVATAATVGPAAGTEPIALLLPPGCVGLDGGPTHGQQPGREESNSFWRGPAMAWMETSWRSIPIRHPGRTFAARVTRGQRGHRWALRPWRCSNLEGTRSTADDRDGSCLQRALAPCQPLTFKHSQPPHRSRIPWMDRLVSPGLPPVKAGSNWPREGRWSRNIRMEHQNRTL